MRSFSSIAFLAAAAASTARAEIECADGLYMIVARGTGEDPDPGTGVTGNLTSKIADRIENSTVIGLDYPAGWAGEVGDDDFFKSVVLGYKVMKETMENYSVACPGHPIAAFGYSQGAQVLSDAVCGGSGGWFNEGAEPVDLDIIEKSGKSLIVSHIDGSHRKKHGLTIPSSCCYHSLWRPNLPEKLNLHSRIR